MLKMFKMYRADNEDIEFKFIHVFRRIEKCDKWAMVRASLGKGKDGAFNPTAPLLAAGQGRPKMGNKKAKQAREDVPAMERLQSSIEKCIAVVVTNYMTREEKEAAREVKFVARWDKMFEKQEVKIDLLKTNVAAIKTKEDLALLTADTSLMCAEVKAWHKAQCDIILAEMRPPPPTTSTTTPAPNPPEAPNGTAPTVGRGDDVEEMFDISFLDIVICTFIAAIFCGEYANSRRE
jgi:hypothetical protein